MAEKRCKVVSCDYRGCSEQAIVGELSANVRDTDGGFTRWNEYKYEPLPEGWTHRYIEGHCRDLCPKHSKEYEELVKDFIDMVVK